MENNPKPFEIYEHFKGNKYQIITLARHSETGEEMVVYQALYGNYQMYVRPLSMFLEKVNGEKESNGKFRFTRVSLDDGQKQQEESQNVKKETEVLENAETKPMKESQVDETIIDPMVLDFLDAATYEERLNILAALHHRITDDMINTMAIAVDVEIEDGPLEERYEELKHCLITFQKYQCSRIR